MVKPCEIMPRVLTLTSTAQYAQKHYEL